MRKNVHIDPQCLATSLVPSVLEEYHKEISGFLIGSNGKMSRKLKVISAYPLQSDIKKRTWVKHGNETAVKRVNGVMKTMQMRLVGGFHSHPLGPNRPSKSDVEFIQNKLEEAGLSHWLELIVSVKKKNYLREHTPGWTVREFENKLGIRIKPTPWIGYDVTFSGYWIQDSGKKREATLWTAKRHNF